MGPFRNWIKEQSGNILSLGESLPVIGTAITIGKEIKEISEGGDIFESIKDIGESVPVLGTVITTVDAIDDIVTGDKTVFEGLKSIASNVPVVGNVIAVTDIALPLISPPTEHQNLHIDPSTGEGWIDEVTGYQQYDTGVWKDTQGREIDEITGYPKTEVKTLVKSIIKDEMTPLKHITFDDNGELQLPQSQLNQTPTNTPFACPKGMGEKCTCDKPKVDTQVRGLNTQVRGGTIAKLPPKVPIIKPVKGVVVDGFNGGRPLGTGPRAPPPKPPDDPPPPPSAPPASEDDMPDAPPPSYASITKPPAGTPPAGTPPAGTPPAGTPPAGTPPAGTPPAVAKPVKDDGVTPVYDKNGNPVAPKPDKPVQVYTGVPVVGKTQVGPPKTPTDAYPVPSGGTKTDPVGQPPAGQTIQPGKPGYKPSVDTIINAAGVIVGVGSTVFTLKAIAGANNPASDPAENPYIDPSTGQGWIDEVTGYQQNPETGDWYDKQGRKIDNATGLPIDPATGNLVESPDSDTPDSGTPDSGTPDSGTPDSGTPDSGTDTPDSGVRDSEALKRDPNPPIGGPAKPPTLPPKISMAEPPVPPKPAPIGGPPPNPSPIGGPAKPPKIPMAEPPVCYAGPYPHPEFSSQNHPPSQYPPQYPLSPYPQYPPSQYPPSQYPPSQYPPSQYPPPQYPPPQYPPPPSQYPYPPSPYYPPQYQPPYSPELYPPSLYPPDMMEEDPLTEEPPTEDPVEEKPKEKTPEELELECHVECCKTSGYLNSFTTPDGKEVLSKQNEPKFTVETEDGKFIEVSPPPKKKAKRCPPKKKKKVEEEECDMDLWLYETDNNELYPYAYEPDQMDYWS
ncbi:MAG: hypothetical protein ACRC1D_06010 [Culicoidibacterales bacterium]